jgi:TATA-binding protein-associated factor Taf7
LILRKGGLSFFIKEETMSNERKKELCLPCEVNTGGPSVEDCTPFQDYLTAEEEESLQALRRIKEESRQIKDKIGELEKALQLKSRNQAQSGNPRAQEKLQRELGDCFQELEKLKISWKEWEDRREEANRRKKVLLGYSP